CVQTSAMTQDIGHGGLRPPCVQPREVASDHGGLRPKGQRTNLWKNNGLHCVGHKRTPRTQNCLSILIEEICMTAARLLDAPRTKGVHLRVGGESLAVDAPKNVLNDDLRQAIRQHKQELLVLLSQPMPAADSVQPTAPTPPAPLTPRYACVICGNADRWNDRG